ncbi:MAG: GNAT family N-acetyltransferase [Bacteroidota bacterium]
MNFNPFPVLETERLILRNLRMDDKQEVFQIRSNPATMQYIPRPLAKTVDDVVSVIEMITGFTARNERINWAVTEKGVDKLIGIIGYVNIKPESLRAEVGYVLHEDNTQKGIAYEALQEVLHYGFDSMDLHSVEAIIRPENTGSIKLIEKAGFVREGYFKDYIFHNGKFWDETVYSMIKQH